MTNAGGSTPRDVRPHSKPGGRRLIARVRENRPHLRGLLPKLVVWLDGQQPTELLLSSGLMVAGLAILSRAVGSELVLAIFYLIPISVAAYFVGRRQGRWIAILSGISWTVIGETIQASTPSVGTLILTAMTRVILFGVVAELLSSLRGAFDHEHELARTDALTGIPNSRAFHERAVHDLLLAKRYKRPLTLLHLDLDGFKAINDQFGHPTGDQVLRKVAVALGQSLRRTDLVARLGGDEFAALLPETGSSTAAGVVAKLQAALSAALAGTPHQVTASIGCVSCTATPEHIGQLLALADQLTYVSKTTGRDRATYQTLTSWESNRPN